MIHRFTILIPDVSDELFDQIAGKCPDTLSGTAEDRACVDFSPESDSLGAAIDSAVNDLTELGISPLSVQVDEMAGIA